MESNIHKRRSSPWYLLSSNSVSKFILSTVMEEEDFPNFSLKFNFPSIQETAEKPNKQQQQAHRFP